MISNEKKRLQVTITKALLKDIKDYCSYTGTTVSDFLSMAAAVYLGVDPTPDMAATIHEEAPMLESWKVDRMAARGV